METDSRKRQALARAYDVFARYPAPTRFDAASPEKGERLFKAASSAPLRQLSENQIGAYAGSAIYTVGGVEDYKHFLPRILELASTGSWQHTGTTPFLIASKLVNADWPRWRVDEREAVMAVMTACWGCALAASPADDDAEEWLATCVTLGRPLDVMLDQWTLALELNATLQLATVMHRLSLRDDGEAPPRWANAPGSMFDRFTDWLGSRTVRARLLEASPAPEDVWLIEQALSWRGSLQ